MTLFTCSQENYYKSFQCYFHQFKLIWVKNITHLPVKFIYTQSSRVHQNIFLFRLSCLLSGFLPPSMRLSGWYFSKFYLPHPKLLPPPSNLLRCHLNMVHLVVHWLNLLRHSINQPDIEYVYTNVCFDLLQFTSFITKQLPTHLYNINIY